MAGTSRVAVGMAVFAAAVLSAGSVATGGIVYLERNGVVVGEAEAFSARAAAANGTNWLVVPDEDAGAGPFVSNARDRKYVQSLPDNQSPGGPMNDPSVRYEMHINTPGTYRLYMRWDGNNTNSTTRGQSDSIFADVVELKDGAGGTVADWYELSEPVNGNFASPAWDGGGGFEQNQAGASGNPMTWDIATPGTYTLRFAQREDGSAVDAFVLQRSNLPGPAGYGPPPSLTIGGPAACALDLKADADAYVRLGGGQNDDHFGTSTQLFVKDSGAGSTTRKGYLRFDVSGVPNRILDAQLQLEVTLNNNGGSPLDPTPKEYVVNVFGLNDGVNDAWVETNSQQNVSGPTPPNPLTWENAPGNNTANNDLIAGDVTLLGQFVVPAINPDQSNDPVIVSFSNFQSDTPDGFADFLNADQDGLVTLILTREGGSNNLGFASREHATALGPTLLVGYVPEPATMGLLSLGVLGLAGYARRRRK